MHSNVSRESCREHYRAKPVKGGKSKCSRCDAEHAPGSAYCASHRAEYQRVWRAKERARIKALEAAVGTWVEPA